MRLRFLGATGTVTGSKYLLELADRRLLIDCGLFQGWKQLRLRNRERLPVEPNSLDAVVLTHAHLDHSGYLPLLAKQGFGGRVHCTHATRDLCGLLLPDSGYLQQEDAAYANRHGFSKHHPALPLYTEQDARRCLDQLHGVDYGREVDLGGGVTLRFRAAGHLLGAATAEIAAAGRRIVFSGDLGRPHDPVMKPPEPVPHADWLLIESTYGNRSHSSEDPRAKLGRIVRHVAARGGVVLIPTFAVGRAQTLLFLLHQLKLAGEIPAVPVYLNSPMAVDATALWHHHRAEHRLSPRQCDAMSHAAHLVRSVEESRALNRRKGPMVILAASGMATGGRVLHHLKALAPDARNAIVFSGFQAGGTRGAALLAGAPYVKIHGEQVRVRAQIDLIDSLSAHADADELVGWLRGFMAPPRRTFVVHGEPDAADALRRRIESDLGWSVQVPDYLQEVELAE